MDFAEAVVEFFVERRGKGAAISAADEQLIMTWEASAIPVSVVFAGIDQAFERRSESPKSLSDCGRWVKAGFKKWSGGDQLGTLERSVGRRDGGADAVGAEPVGGRAAEAPAALRSAPDPVVATKARLAVWAACPEPALAAAAAELLDELDALGDGVGEELLAIVDEATAEAALERLEANRRTEVVARAEALLSADRMSGAAWARARAAEVLRLLGG